MMMQQQGAALLLAMMIAQGPHGAPQDKAQVSAPKPAPMLIAAADVETKTGAFRKLSARDQKIARNVLEAEQVGNKPAWSLDKIASARAAGKGWQTIIVAMQDERLVMPGDPGDVMLGRTGKIGESLTDIAVASGPGDGEAAKAKQVAAMPGAKGDSGCAVKAGTLQPKGKDLVQAE